MADGEHWASPRIQQPVKGPSPQTKRSIKTQSHMKTQIKDSKEATHYLGTFQSCPRKASAPVSWCETP